MQSIYLKKLLVENPFIAARYLEKIKIINWIDPYTFEDADVDFGVDIIPPVSSIDIVT
jgi:hypothetical protein